MNFEFWDKLGIQCWQTSTVNLDKYLINPIILAILPIYTKQLKTFNGMLSVLDIPKKYIVTATTNNINDIPMLNPQFTLRFDNSCGPFSLPSPDTLKPCDKKLAFNKLLEIKKIIHETLEN